MTKKVPVILQCLLVAAIALSFGGDPTWIAPADAAKVPNPLSSNATTIAAGQKTFRLQCASCHGDKGKGDGIASLGLTKRPADFLDKSIVGETDGSLFWKISTGNKPMPSFKTKLTEQQRWEVILYIRQLQQNK